MRLDSRSPGGRLTLETPAPFRRLALLGFSTGSGDPVRGDVIVSFTDASSSTYSSAFVATYWNDRDARHAFSISGVVNISDGMFISGTLGDPPFLSISEISLKPADQLKEIASIVINRGSESRAYIMAVSGLAASGLRPTDAKSPGGRP